MCSVLSVCVGSVCVCWFVTVPPPWFCGPLRNHAHTQKGQTRQRRKPGGKREGKRGWLGPPTPPPPIPSFIQLSVCVDSVDVCLCVLVLSVCVGSVCVCRFCVPLPQYPPSYNFLYVLILSMCVYVCWFCLCVILDNDIRPRILGRR